LFCSACSDQRYTECRRTPLCLWAFHFIKWTRLDASGIWFKSCVKPQLLLQFVNANLHYTALVSSDKIKLGSFMGDPASSRDIKIKEKRTPVTHHGPSSSRTSTFYILDQFCIDRRRTYHRIEHRCTSVPLWDYHSRRLGQGRLCQSSQGIKGTQLDRREN
jgi:hypothetical protein